MSIKEVQGNKRIGTEITYADGNFDTKDGKAEFKPAPWNGLLKPVADQGTWGSVKRVGTVEQWKSSVSFKPRSEKV